jgi:hypothetical protein
MTDTIFLLSSRTAANHRHKFWAAFPSKSYPAAANPSALHGSSFGKMPSLTAVVGNSPFVLQRVKQRQRVVSLLQKKIASWAKDKQCFRST